MFLPRMTLLPAIAANAAAQEPVITSVRNAAGCGQGAIDAIAPIPAPIVSVRISVHPPPFGSDFDERVSALASKGVEIIVTQEPTASPSQPFSEPNLTMGGEQRRRCTFGYRGLKN
jgi:hypothetical protein